MADKVLVLVGSNAARSRIHIPANLTFTVEDIKAVLHATWAIPSDQRCLVHMGDIMNDERRLNTIPNGNDEVLRFWLLPPCVLLQIRLLNGRCFTVESSEDDRVEDVKFTIDYEENIPAREIRLVLAGKELDDMDTIGDAGITNNIEIELVRCPADSFLYIDMRAPDGSRRFFKVSISMTKSVADLKAAIHAHEGIPPEDQRLWNHRHERLLENGRPLYSYFIKSHMAITGSYGPDLLASITIG